MGFSSLSDILKVIQKQNSAFSRSVQESQILTRWKEAVGDAIAQHTEVVSLKDGKLWVRVDHPAWRSELNMRKHQILKKMLEGLDEHTQSFLQEIVFLNPGKQHSRDRTKGFKNGYKKGNPNDREC